MLYNTMNYAITLTGRPISANQMWRSSLTARGKPFVYMPTAAKDMKTFWQMQATKQRNHHGFKISNTDEIGIDIKFYFETKARRDIDNYLKVTLDSLTGVVYEDDKQIKYLRAEKFYDPINPRIEIIITI